MKMSIYKANVSLNGKDKSKEMIILANHSGVLLIDEELFAISFEPFPSSDDNVKITDIANVAKL